MVATLTPSVQFRETKPRTTHRSLLHGPIVAAPIALVLVVVVALVVIPLVIERSLLVVYITALVKPSFVDTFGSLVALRLLKSCTTVKPASHEVSVSSCSKTNYLWTER